MIELFSGNYMLYQKIKYISSIIFLIGIGLFKFVDARNLIIISTICMIIIYIANEYFVRNDSKINPRVIMIFNYIELVLYNLFDFLFPDSGLLAMFWSVLIISSGVSFIVDSSEFEKSTVFFRKIIFSIPVAIKVFISISTNSEAEWFVYFFGQSFICESL